MSTRLIASAPFAPKPRTAMPLSHRWTLARYLLEERRRFPGASGELNALILDISLACKAIARVVAYGELSEDLGAVAAWPPGGDVGTQGEVQRPLDVLSNQIFTRMNEWNGHHGRHGQRRIARTGSDSRDLPAWQVSAGVRAAGRQQPHRRQRLGGHHIFHPARAATSHRQRARRGGGRLSAAWCGAGGRGLRHLWAYHATGAHGGQRRGRLHAEPQPRRIRAHAQHHQRAA